MVRQYTVHSTEPRTMPKAKLYRPSPEARKAIDKMLSANPRDSANRLINAAVLLAYTPCPADKRRGAKAKGAK